MGGPTPGRSFFCTELRRSPRGCGFHNGATCTALFLWEARPRGEAFFAPSCVIRRRVAAPTMGRRALLCFCGRPDPGAKPGRSFFCAELRHSPRGRGFHNGATCTALFLWEARPRGEAFLHRTAPFAAGSRFPQWLRRALLCFCGRPDPGAKLFCTELRRSPRGRGSHNGATCTALFSRKTRRRMHFKIGRAGVAHQTSCA